METIIVDKKLYSLRAIFGTAYIFLENFYIFLDKVDEEKISIQIKAKNSEQDESKIVDDFKNELINTSLRLKISEENKKIREMIVSSALYGRNTALVESSKQFNESKEQQEMHHTNCRKEPGDSLRPINDPKGISKTWEEVNGDERLQEMHHTNCRKEPGDSLRPINDPEGISKTWEEVNGDERSQEMHHTNCRKEVCSCRDNKILGRGLEDDHKAVNRIFSKTTEVDYFKMFDKEGDGDKN